MTLRRRVAIGLLACTAACSSAPSRTGAIEIDVRHSRFVPDALTVAAGSEVTFTVTNGDPIAHEFILGTREEQLAHERGRETDHDGSPGAASLEPGEVAEVRYRFERPGTYEYACHLAGHYGYGMVGVVTVT